MYFLIKDLILINNNKYIFKKYLNCLSIRTIVKFTEKEKRRYILQANKAKFKSPLYEYKWSINNFKVCSKCNSKKNLTLFNNNTSSNDGFDKDGYRLKRSECKECTNKISRGKRIAKKLAKEEGIFYKPPIGTKCEICNKPGTKNNKIVFDHCHETNTFRGYCCNSCNRSIGILGDNINGIINVFNYLNKNEKIIIKQKDFNIFIDS